MKSNSNPIILTTTTLSINPSNLEENKTLNFWKEVAVALVDKKHNTETARNDYPIIMFQGGLLHKPYFIAIDNRRQVIIGPRKKMVATYVVGELEILI